jgi:hypothetical protein
MAKEPGGVSGIGIAAVFAGGILVWSGVKGTSVSGIFRDLIAGKDPSKLPQTTPVSVGGLASALNPLKLLSSSPSGTYSGPQLDQSSQQNRALGQKMASSYGWSSGAQWDALNNLVMGESGWNQHAANPTSNARGIAQNINGWGANYQENNAGQQIQWLLQYIKQRYGDPVSAWNAWQSRNPHWY